MMQLLPAPHHADTNWLLINNVVVIYSDMISIFGIHIDLSLTDAGCW